MPDSVTDAGLTIAAFIVCLVAWWKGSAPERWGASLIAFAWLFVAIAQGVTKSEIPIGWILIADVTLATGFLGIALRYSSVWLGAAMLFQGAEIAGHAAFMEGWTGRFVYITWLDVMSVLVLVSIFGGTLTSIRGRARARISNS